MNRFFLVILASLALTAPVSAQQFDSAYTDLDFDQCTVLRSDEFGVSFACPGYKGYPVYVAEGDLRMFVSYGFGAPEEKAASQTLGPFNNLGPRIEWRLSNESGEWRPFATIIRYFTQPDLDYEGEALVVTTLGPYGVCQVAHIDARANPDANELARQMADLYGQNFDCAAREPEVIGVRGQSF
jgi:hypothetical protein